ncbi:MAG TPA: protein kinase, partial [Labilithrix sp.]
MSDLVGSVVADRWEIVAFAGAGGMGSVYRARDKKSDATVALKMLAASGDAQRFAREAGVLSRLEHANIVRYLDHGAEGETKYLVMEWLAGEDLGMRLDADGALAVSDAIAVARQAASALAAAHRAGVVHRDLKPANLFLVDRSFANVKLLDFGVARTESAVDLTVSGAVVGTPPYMAPEQVRGDAIAPTADVYGLGALLYRCLAGKPPFEGAHNLAVLAKVILETPVPIRELRPDVPPALDALVSRLLAKDAAERPIDGAAVIEELDALDASAIPSERHLRASVSAREKRVACVLLCANGIADDVTVQTTEIDRVGHQRELARRAVEARGGSVAALSRGAWLVTIPNVATAGEQALRAARCALALAESRPQTPIYVATGRVLVAGESRVGEVIDRASAALVAGAKPGIRVDASTAELLGGRFRIEGDGDWRMLVGEEEGALPARTLLGKPAACLGRDAQLAMLNAALASCADESRAGAALVSAPAGLGKTHLVRELLRQRAQTDIDVLVAKGDPIRAASPFGLAAELLLGASRDTKSLASLVERDFPEAERGRMRELLGEIAGVATAQADASPAMRAARADLAIMADALRDAWTAWLGARAAKAQVVVVVEDVHWADAASLRLMQAAMTSLADKPVFLLATSRPEGVPSFAEKFRSAGLVEIALAPLSPVSAERLVRRALGDISAERVQTLVRRSGGHPFLLEELVRAVADGRGEDALPDS